MQQQALTAVLLSACLSCCCGAPFQNLVVFGDSLSDDGDEHGLQAIVQRATQSDVVRH